MINTPWEVASGDIWPVEGCPRVKIATMVKPSPMNQIDWEANAAFIVRACNSHEELLVACKEALQMMTACNMVKPDNYLSRAIQKAEGQS